MSTSVHSALNIDDLRRMAHRRVPKFVSEPIERGAGDGGCAQRNIEAFRRYRLLPQVLVDVSPVDTSNSLFSRLYDLPMGISAVGSAGLLRHNADLYLAEAAREANIPFMLSGSANASVEEVARVAPDHLWYQLYAPRDEKLSDHIIGRARDAGVDVLVYTVDFPVRPRNEVMLRTGVSMTTHPPLTHLPRLVWDAVLHPSWTIPYLLAGGRPKLGGWVDYARPNANARDVAKVFGEKGIVNHTWREVERIRAAWPGKLVIKGIMHPDDARRAVQLGADAITVSNHAGNKLDSMPATIDMLPFIRAAVGDKVPVLFDGGIRRASDVIIAHALGATHCFLGRATLYGVVAGGAVGARKAIELLRADLLHSMAMLGTKTMSDINSGCLANPDAFRQSLT